MIGWVTLTLSCRQANFANRCPSRDLGSRSWKGHPVHFPRPIYYLSQISKILLKRFDVRGKSLCGGGRGGNQLETSSHPRPGWLNNDISGHTNRKMIITIDIIFTSQIEFYFHPWTHFPHRHNLDLFDLIIKHQGNLTGEIVNVVQEPMGIVSI